MNEKKSPSGDEQDGLNNLAAGQETNGDGSDSKSHPFVSCKSRLHLWRLRRWQKILNGKR